MPNWDDMSDREKDAWGAEHIMEYVIYKNYDSFDGVMDKKIPYRMLLSPEYLPTWVERFGSSDNSVPDKGDVLTDCPHYSTDAAADYEILKRVAETWGTPEYNRFSDALSVILWKRYMADEKSKVICEPDGTSKADYDGVWLIKYLKEGDYLHAAWLAKNGE